MINKTDGNQTHTAAAGTETGSDAAARGEARRLAQEFEALIITQMLRDLRRSMVDDEPNGSTFGAMTDTFDAELGRTLSAAGGFGLGEALMRGITRSIGGGDETLVPAPGEPSSDVQPTPPAELPATLLPENTTRVTSAFGWRRDPISGAAAFHSGVDLRMAYGQDVNAAARGRVVFAGEKGGYGNMVAVLHDDGRETRYAHLSEQYVHVGDIVEAGQVLGKSGNSGRTTGPHLHFEVRVNGRAVDPSDES